jgi:CelD/BcsL family acetyltransferase involved in cellulose biosynthesis
MTTQDSICRQAYHDEAMALHDTLQAWVPRLLSETGGDLPAEFRFWATQINDEFRLLHERMQWVLSMGQAVDEADLACLRDLATRAARLGQRDAPGGNGAA